MKFLFTFLVVLVIWLGLISLATVGDNQINPQHLFYIGIGLTLITATIGFKR